MLAVKRLHCKEKAMIQSDECVQSTHSFTDAEDFGQLLLHTRPGRDYIRRSLLLGFLCSTPSWLMLLILFTADPSHTQDDWVILGIGIMVTLGFLAATFFIMRAYNASKRHLFLYENGLVERQGNQTRAARYDELKLYQTSVQVAAYGVVTLAKASDYKLQFPDGYQSLLDWNRHRHPIGELVQGQIYQAQLPHAVVAFNQGQDVRFGAVCLSQRGIQIGKKSFLWSEIDRVQLIQGSFYAYRTGSQRTVASVAYREIPNALVFSELLRRLGR